MTVNPAGYVPVFDYGMPMTITASAREIVSGGWFLAGSAAANTVSSGINSYVATDIEVAKTGSALNFIGIATKNAASGALVTIQRGGVHIVRAAGTIKPGTTVSVIGGDAVVEGTTAGALIGRSLTASTSGNYVVIDLAGA